MPYQLKPLSARLRDLLAKAEAKSPKPAAKAPGKVCVRAAADNTVELLIYGPIGMSWWDDESITARQVVEQLRDAEASTIEVRINSIGGSVSDGLAIHTELRRQARTGVTVNVTVDSVACSIASLIAAAGDHVVMPSNTLQMLHAPMGTLLIDGNAKDVREVSQEFADRLDVMGRAMSESYARKSGRPASDFDAMWETGKDYWYTAEEALAAGLCDEVLDANESPADDDTATAMLEPLLAAAPDWARQIRAALRVPEAAASAPAPLNPPAPAGAQVAPVAATTTGATQMPDNTKTAEQLQAEKLQQDQISAAVSAQITAMRDRNSEIKAIAEPHFGNPAVRALYDDVIAAADPEITAADVGTKILAIMAKGRGPLGGDIRQTEDERDNRMAGMAKALQARLGHAKHEDGNPYRGQSLYDMAATCASAAGVNTRGMPREDVVRAAITHTSSDFPQLAGNAVRTATLRGYNEFPEVFPDFTRAISVPDFKKQSLAGLGQFIGIQEIAEGKEYPYGTFSEIGQEIQLKKMGGIFSITDEAIINDELSLFDTVPNKMGAAAKRALGDRVFALITSNPTLGDGVALFHANHNNLLTGAAPTTAAVDAMIAKMALQKDSAGNPVRVPLKFVLVPVGMGGLVRQILDSQYEIATGKNLTAPNYVRGRFVVIEDPRLDGNSTTAWYGVADPAVIDGIVVAYRDGVQEPKVTQKEGWNVDGIEFKVRLDAAPGIASFMGLNKNPGA
ncbi:MAG: ClpP-like prohead protease/major capsid protein fusion protein [Lysobacter sp.]